MAIQILKSGDRSYFDEGWLKTYQTFSHDSSHQGFRSLRAINEDRIIPGVGFPLQTHREMEMISIVIEGGLSHQDDNGNCTILRPGQIQLISAGTGITHSELNASDKEEAHILQIWILPNVRQLKPSYQEKSFPPSISQNKWCLIASPDGREGSLLIHQDVSLYLTDLDKDKELNKDLVANRYGWIQLIKGEIEINDTLLESGDGAAISEITSLHIKAHSDSKLILFDL